MDYWWTFDVPVEDECSMNVSSLSSWPQIKLATGGHEVLLFLSPSSGVFLVLSSAPLHQTERRAKEKNGKKKEPEARESRELHCCALPDGGYCCY
jgi:hypothetical protein